MDVGLRDTWGCACTVARRAVLRWNGVRRGRQRVSVALGLAASRHAAYVGGRLTPGGLRGGGFVPRFQLCCIARFQCG